MADTAVPEEAGGRQRKCSRAARPSARERREARKKSVGFKPEKPEPEENDFTDMTRVFFSACRTGVYSYVFKAYHVFHIYNQVCWLQITTDRIITDDTISVI